MYAEDHARYATAQDAFIYVAINAYWEDMRFSLPTLPEDYSWKLAFETGGFSSDAGSELQCADPYGITLGSRTAAVLIGTA